MNTKGESYVIWSLPMSNLWHPPPPYASSRSPEAISGIPLCKQEFVLQEVTVAMGLEILIYTYTGREGERLHAICCKAHLSIIITQP